MDTGAQYLPGGGAGRVDQWWGIYQGYIAVNADPLSMGRVKLRVPQVFGKTTSGWALPMIPLGYVPKVGTTVTVMFVGGDPTQPVWFGNFAIPGGAVGWTFSTIAPSNPEIGQIWLNTSTGLMSEWNGAGWVAYQIGGAAIQTGVALAAPNITGGVITGAQFIADGTSGEYLGYTGTPATGNLFFSVSPMAGTDSKSNPYLEGVTVYDGSTAYLQMHVNSGIGAPAIEMPTGIGSEFSHPAIYAWSPNKGTTAEYEKLVLLGPASTFDQAQPSISLLGAAKDGSAGAGVIIGNGFMSGYATLSITDTSNISVPTTNASTAITPTYTIAAGDAKAGTMYRWTILCHGTQAGASQPNISFSALAFGVGPFGNINMSTTQIPVGDIYDCIVEAWIQVVTPGASGTANFIIRASVSPVNSVQSTVSNSLTAVGTDTLATVHTATSAGMNIQCAIGSAGSGGLHSYSSTFERLGP